VKANKSGAMVTLELFDKRPLAEDTRFVNFNHSLMGDRMVVMVPGNSLQKMNEEEIQEGLFANGVAETIHSVDKLLDMVFNYNQMATRMQNPRDSMGSWSGLVQGKVYPLFDEIHRLSSALQQARASIEPRLASVTQSTDHLESLAHSVNAQAGHWIQLTLSTTQTLDSLSQTGVQVIATLDSLLQWTAGPNASLRPLFFEQTLYEKTLQLTEVLQSALAILQNDGLNIIHAHNLHFFSSQSGEEGSPKSK
jgi:hypothetical protein